MPYFGTGFDPTQPTDLSAVALGAAWIRDLKTRLAGFLAVSFNVDTGTLLAAAIPNGVTVPYGAAGTIYTSTGVSTPPSWSAPGTIITGMIFPYGGPTNPAGYLACDGSSQVIATYPALAAIIGTTFGGDGITTFGLPDCRGRTLVGIGTGDAPDASAWSVAQKKGEETHTLSSAEMPSHAHTVPTGAGGVRADGNTADSSGIISDRNSVSSSTVGGGGAHNNTQPSLGIFYVIKT